MMQEMVAQGRYEQNELEGREAGEESGASEAPSGSYMWKSTLLVPTIKLKMSPYATVVTSHKPFQQRRSPRRGR